MLHAPRTAATAKSSLSSVTAICVDTHYHQMALSACCRMARHGFAEVVLVTDTAIDSHLSSVGEVATLRVVHIPTLAGGGDYSRYVLSSLVEHVHTPHALVFQWDGFVRDPARWSPDFLEYDYIGAPWSMGGEYADRRVGNGGFSLRSARLLHNVARMVPAGGRWAEDAVICLHLGDVLEKQGLRFAPVSVAKHFSVEQLSFPEMHQQDPDSYAEATFGFHGFYNFHLAFSDSQLLDLVDCGMGPPREALLGTWAAGGLLRNLLSAGRGQVAAQLATRIAGVLKIDPQVAMAFAVASLCMEKK